MNEEEREREIVPMLPKKFSIVVDLGCFLIVSIVNAFLALITPPFRRGFFCNDDSIKYPFVNEELLPTWTLLLVSVILPVFTVSVSISMSFY